MHLNWIKCSKTKVIFPLLIWSSLLLKVHQITQRAYKNIALQIKVHSVSEIICKGKHLQSFQSPYTASIEPKSSLFQGSNDVKIKLKFSEIYISTSLLRTSTKIRLFSGVRCSLLIPAHGSACHLSKIFPRFMRAPQNDNGEHSRSCQGKAVSMCLSTC